MTVVRGGFRICNYCGSRVRLQTVTGRILKAKPVEMQNIPIRTAEGRRVSDAFPKSNIPVFDYKELELRIFAACENHHRDLGQCSQCLRSLQEGSCPKCSSD